MPSSIKLFLKDKERERVVIVPLSGGHAEPASILSSLQELKDELEAAAFGKLVLDSGPSESRWTKVKEIKVDKTTKLKGGTIDIVTDYTAQSLLLSSHVGESLAPISTKVLELLPPSVDLYKLIMRHDFPKPKLLDTDEAFDSWRHATTEARSQSMLRSQVIHRLVAKARVGLKLRSEQPSTPIVNGEGAAGEEGEEGRLSPLPPPEEEDLDTPDEKATRALVKDRLILESIEGIYELSLDKSNSSRVSIDLLKALCDGLRCEVPAIRTVATVACWNFSRVAEVRKALVELGSTSLLLEVIEDACRLRKAPVDTGGVGESGRENRGGRIEEGESNPKVGYSQLSCYNRIIYNALGSLGVMAVDLEARKRVLLLSPSLGFLVELCSLDFPLPSREQEGSQVEEGTVTEAEVDGLEQQEQTEQILDPESNEAVPTDEADLSGGTVPSVEPLPPPTSKGHQETQQDDLLPEDSPYHHQKLASETLYSMLARDRSVRASFAKEGGLNSLISLINGPNNDVRFCVCQGLAAYAKDIGTDHEEGILTLREAGCGSQIITALIPVIEASLSSLREETGEGLMGLGEQSSIMSFTSSCALALWGAMTSIATQPDASMISMSELRRLASAAKELVDHVLSQEDNSLASNSLTSIVFCLLSMVGMAFRDQRLLRNSHQSLIDQAEKIRMLEEKVDSLNAEIQSSRQLKTTQSRFVLQHEEEEQERELGRKLDLIVLLEDQLIEATSSLEADKEEIEEAAERSSSIAITILSEMKSSSWTRHLQLMAVGIISSMAASASPSITALEADTEPLFKGPYRELLLDKGAILVLKKLVQDCAEDDPLSIQIRLLASSAHLHCVAIQHPLDSTEPSVALLSLISRHPESTIYGASSIFCLTRHAENRRGLLKLGPDLLTLCEGWTSVSLDKIRKKANRAGYYEAQKEVNRPISSRTLRYICMSIWAVCRQWLGDHTLDTKSEDDESLLVCRSSTSFWKPRIDPSLNAVTLDEGIMVRGLKLILSIAKECFTFGGYEDADFALRCAFCLSFSQPECTKKLVEHGLGDLIVDILSAASSPSFLLCTSVAFLSHLFDTPTHVEAIGGYIKACNLLISFLVKSFESSDARGKGGDILLAERVVRSLARLALAGPEAREALLTLKCVQHLVTIVKKDNEALSFLEAERAKSGIPLYEDPILLLCPLRGINGLEPVLGAQQREALKELKALAPSPPPSPYRASSPGLHASATIRPRNVSNDGAASQALPTDKEEGGQGDGDIGLLAIWGLLNLSGFPAFQVSICSRGLYTLLRSIHNSRDTSRVRSAAAILNNVHYHPENSTILYKAELKLKHAALLHLKNTDRHASKGKHTAAFSKPRASSARKNERPATATANKGTLERVKEHFKSGLDQVASLRSNAATGGSNPELQTAETNLAYLQWLVDPTHAVLGTTPETPEVQGDLPAADDLMKHLTMDEEEVAFLSHLSAMRKIEDASEIKHSTGVFLRSTLARSLAEGPSSLWGGRNPLENRMRDNTAGDTSLLSSGRQRTGAVGGIPPHQGSPRVLSARLKSETSSPLSPTPHGTMRLTRPTSLRPSSPAVPRKAWAPSVSCFVQKPYSSVEGASQLSPLVEKTLLVGVPSEVASKLAVAAQSLCPPASHERNEEKAAPLAEASSASNRGLRSFRSISDNLMQQNTAVPTALPLLSPRESPSKDAYLSTSYCSPHFGREIPPGVLTSSLKPKPVTSNTILKALASVDQAEKEGIRDKAQLAAMASAILTKRPMPRVPIDNSVPRPTTVISATMDDLINLAGLQDFAASGLIQAEAGEANLPFSDLRLAKDKVCHPWALSIKISTGDGGPDKLFGFTKYASNDHHHNLSLWEHVPGCSYCTNLYGHYLLPSGKLAHLCLFDEVVKGHQVDLIPPTEVPFETREWFDNGLPACNLLAADPSRHLLSAEQGGLKMDLWCPIPLLPRPPDGNRSYILEWEEGKEGKVLKARATICLSAEIITLTRQEIETTIIPPKPKKKK